eukprot:888355-Amphidinium_carterae.1
MNDTNEYLWFTWLTEAQYNDFHSSGQVPGYKDTRGHNVHRHHRLHNTPNHCINLHIHNRWNAVADNDNYGSNKPIFLLVWKTSINNVLANSHAQANAHSSVYFRRAEDVSLEFNPVFNGQDPMNLHLQALMGRPIGVWKMDDWHRIDNNASTILWLDHSISAWCVTDTQWHLNEYSAITMLNAPSLRRTFRGFCENNGLSTMLYKYKGNDGTMKP